MNLLDMITGAQGGGAVRQLGQNFGLDERQTQSAISALLPALSTGLKCNLAAPEGAQNLISALTRGNHQRYLEDPSVLGQEDTIREGNGILSHVLGSKDVSRQVASRASQSTGIGEGVLKKMLPVVAAMAMGSLSKQTASSRMGAVSGGGQVGGLLGLLTPMLDSNCDGNVADDLLGMAAKMFR